MAKRIIIGITSLIAYGGLTATLFIFLKNVEISISCFILSGALYLISVPWVFFPNAYYSAFYRLGSWLNRSSYYADGTQEKGSQNQRFFSKTMLILQIISFAFLGIALISIAF